MGGAGWPAFEYMTLTKEQRVAICCIVADIASEMGVEAMLDDFRHYRILQEAVGLTDTDKEAARGATVLSSLAVLKEVHYRVKMMIGMIAAELYAENVAVPLIHRRAFEVLMTAIEWPVSFDEIHALS